MAKALTKSQIADELANKSNITRKAAAEILEFIAELNH
jgi:nucleoid DNA-binding protein